MLFILLALAISFGLDKKAEAALLNSGFFDVTQVEQAITEKLQGRIGPNGQGSMINDQAGTATGTPTTATSTTSTSTAPATKPAGSFLQDLFGTSQSTAADPDERSEGPYIEIVDPSGFVNSQPFKLADLVGKKVILLDFIDYSCINCERTFPYLEEWYNKYGPDGFVVVAIHTPEFAFEKQISNVQAAAKQFGLTFPIVLDNDYATWNAYQNEYWPHKYLIDIHGNIVYDHIGEGNYDQTEAEIVKQLNIAHAFLGEPADVTEATTSLPSDYTINADSPETYFGSSRNEYFGNGDPGVAGTQVYPAESTSATLSPDEFYLGGSWDIEQEYAQAKSASSTISYVFDAANMYMVAASADGTPVTATILIDGKPIPAAWQGADVQDGILTITGSRLYSLFSSSIMGQHRIDIIFNKPGVQAYTFTFG